MMLTTLRRQTPLPPSLLTSLLTPPLASLLTAPLVLLVLLVPLLLAGCAATAAAEPTLVRILSGGLRSKADIARQFGTPSVFKFDSGYAVWVYQERHLVPNTTRYLPIVGPVVGLIPALIPARTKELVLLFAPDGMLKKYRMSRDTLGAVQP